MNICDLAILVPTNKGEHGPFDDSHLVINHILAHWFQNSISRVINKIMTSRKNMEQIVVETLLKNLK